MSDEHEKLDPPDEYGDARIGAAVDDVSIAESAGLDMEEARRAIDELAALRHLFPGKGESAGEYGRSEPIESEDSKRVDGRMVVEWHPVDVEPDQPGTYLVLRPDSSGLPISKSMWDPTGYWHKDPDKYDITHWADVPEGMGLEEDTSDSMWKKPELTLPDEGERIDIRYEGEWYTGEAVEASSGVVVLTEQGEWIEVEDADRWDYVREGEHATVPAESSEDDVDEQGGGWFTCRENLPPHGAEVEVEHDDRRIIGEVKVKVSDPSFSMVVPEGDRVPVVLARGSNFNTKARWRFAEDDDESDASDFFEPPTELLYCSGTGCDLRRALDVEGELDLAVECFLHGMGDPCLKSECDGIFIPRPSASRIIEEKLPDVGRLVCVHVDPPSEDEEVVVGKFDRLGENSLFVGGKRLNKEDISGWWPMEKHD